MRRFIFYLLEYLRLINKHGALFRYAIFLKVIYQHIQKPIKDPKSILNIPLCSRLFYYCVFEFCVSENPLEAVKSLAFSSMQISVEIFVKYLIFAKFESGLFYYNFQLALD